MERLRSFSFKSTRFLVFSFTLSSSIIFLTFFTVWLFKSGPSILQEANFEFNRSSLVLGHKPISVWVLNGSARNFSPSGFKNSILTDTRFQIPENTSGFASIIGRDIDEYEMRNDERDKSGNFTVLQDSSPRSEISFGKDPIGREKDGFEMRNDERDRRGDFTVVQPIPEISSGKEQLVSGEKIEEKKIKAISMGMTEIAGKIKATTFENIEPTSEGDNQEKKKRENPVEIINVSSRVSTEKRSTRECDPGKGKWIYDENYPLYTSSLCPFIDEGFDCVGNGRLDEDYMKWRWQPQDCDIPRFNATRMLDLIRGKRVVFVGDSINRNQWESMLCMLMAGVRDPKMVYETHGRKITKEKGNYSFKFVDYKCSVEYYVSHFLVHEGKARVGQKRVQTLRIDAIDHGSSRWRGADILIFNTAHWWSHFKTKAGINYYQEGNIVHPKLDVSTAFRRALMTWASWVDRHINPKKTRVFFRSSAPSHFRGGQWNSGGHCEEATRPLNNTSGMGVSEKNMITEDIIKQMRTPVTFLNVTSLSEFRIDGHPSKYGKIPSKRRRSSGQDCSHWCLPGVPDTWNELLYFHLQNKQRGTFQ